MHDRLRLGHGLLGAAIAAKLYPVVLLPLTVAYVWRRRGRREGIVCAALAVGGRRSLAYLPFAVLAPREWCASVGRQLSRPLQIESLGSAILLAAHDLFGTGVEVGSSHGSQNLVGTSAGRVRRALSVAQIAVLAWLWVRFARSRELPSPRDARGQCRGGRDGLRRARQGALAAVPDLARARSSSLAPAARARTRCSLAALVLTQLWFPFRYWDLVRELDPRVSWLVLARDLVLLALLATLVRAVREPARGSSRSS